MSIQLPTWVVWALWGLIGVSALLALHALFWDWIRRARQPDVRRCPCCWYDMSAGGMTCPECGRTAKSERAMHRARRRWPLVVVALVLALSSLWTLFLTRATYRQLARLSPTWLLLMVAGDPCTPPPTDAQGNISPDFESEFRLEAWRRSALGQLSPSESRSLAKRQFASPAWDVLSLKTRPRWPRGVPLWAEVTSSFRGARDRDLVASSPWKGGDHYTASFAGSVARVEFFEQAGWWMTPTPEPCNPVLVNLGTPTPEAREALLTGLVSEGKNQIYTHVARAPITVVDTIDDAITPDTSDALRSQLTKYFSRLLYLSPDGHRIAVPRSLPLTPNLAVAVRVEFMWLGDVIASAPLVVRSPAPEGTSFNSTPPDPGVDKPLSYYFDLNMLNDSSWARLTGPGVPIESTSGLKVRVSSDPELALRQFDATSYWKGEFSFDFVPQDVPDQTP